MLKKNVNLFRFFKLLIQFRKNHPCLRREGIDDLEDAGVFPVVWHGKQPGKPDWSTESRCLAVQISEMLHYDMMKMTEIYIAVNAFWEQIKFNLPELSEGKKWHRIVDTKLAPPLDIYYEENALLLEKQGSYEVGPRSVIVLVGKSKTKTKEYLP